MADAPRLLCAAREDAGMTQRALAEAVGARQPHIAGIESVSAEMLERVPAHIMGSAVRL